MNGNNKWFDVSHLKTDLRGRSVRGGVSMLGSQVFSLALRTFSAIALARLVAPAAYGLVGMVSAFTAFAHLIKDIGLAQATIQRPSITHEQVSVLFWINMALSTGLMLVIGLCAPLFAWFYNEPELVKITWAASTGFFLGGLSIQHHALLQRQMRFGSLARIEICAGIGGVLVALAMAYKSGEYWALIGLNLATLAFRAIGMWCCCGWLPGRPRRGTGVRDMLKFGAGITGFNVVNYFSRNLDNILIGKVCGTETLGYYAKAYSLLMLPITQLRTPIINVGLPAICALRDDPERYKRYYRQIIFLLALISMPLVSYLYLFCDHIIVLLLGDRWYPAARLFRLLAIVAFIQSVATTGRALPIYSMGYAKRNFFFGVVQSVVTCMGMAIGIYWGAEGVAIGYAVAYYVLLMPTIPWCLKGSPVAGRDWVAAVWRPALACGVMVMAVGLGRVCLFPDINALGASFTQHAKILVYGGLAVTVIYALVMMAMPMGMRDLSEAGRHLMNAMLHRRQRAQ
jgi:O-antigen/teichoic acid export membrane protein